MIVILIILLIKFPYVSGPLGGAAFAAVGYFHYINEHIGIITVTWHAIFGAIVFAIILIDGIAFDTWIEIVPLIHDLEADPRQSSLTDIHNRIEGVKDGLWNLVRLLIQGFLSFAAITGVTMSILFREGFSDPELKMTAIQMTSGFLLSSLSLYMWVVIPIMRRIRITNTLMRFRSREKVGIFE